MHINLLGVSMLDFRENDNYKILQIIYIMQIGIVFLTLELINEPHQRFKVLERNVSL